MIIEPAFYRASNEFLSLIVKITPFVFAIFNESDNSPLCMTSLFGYFGTEILLSVLWYKTFFLI